MHAPRNVSMTCPFRKKAEKPLQVFLVRREAFEGVMNRDGPTGRREGGTGPAAFWVREHDV